MIAKRKITRQKVSSAKSLDAEVDYAATADLHAGEEDSNSSGDEQTNDDAESRSSDEENNNVNLEASESEEDNVDADGSENSDDDDENSNEEEGSRDNIDQESEDESDDEEMDDEELNNEQRLKRPSPQNPVGLPSATGESCTFDLRNLLAMNSHQINAEKLYNAKISSNRTEVDNATIPWTGGKLFPNEDYLLEKAVDGCSQLVSAIWQLPVERSDAGPLVHLPGYDESRIPRTLVSCRLLYDV
jgi:hypothetical protein